MPKTHVDWFGFRAKDTPDVMAMALSEVVPDHMAISLSKRKTGWRSFESSFDVWLTDTRGNPETDCCRVGMAMTGAMQGLEHVFLSGEGCGWVTDWGRAMDVCTDQLPAFELKRVDLALTGSTAPTGMRLMQHGPLVSSVRLGWQKPKGKAHRQPQARGRAHLLRGIA